MRSKSTFLHVSSSDRDFARHDVNHPHGNGEFLISLNTGAFPYVTHVAPSIVTVPNIFTNVNRYRNRFLSFHTTSESSESQDWSMNDLSVPVGRYSSTEFNNKFNSMLNGVWAMNSDTDTQYKTSIVGGGGVKAGSWIAPLEFFEMLGFTSDHPDMCPVDQLVHNTKRFHPGYPDSARQTILNLFARHTQQSDYFTNPNAKTRIYHLMITKSTAAPPTAIGDTVTNFGGEQIIHVKASELGRASTLEGRDGNTENVLATIPVNVPFGELLTFQSSDLHLSMIQIKGQGASEHTMSMDPVNINLISIVDHYHRPLFIPMNHHIHILMKLIHTNEL